MLAARYGLTNMSKYLVTGSKFDLGPFLLIAPETSDYTALNYLREVVEDDTHAWQLAFGVDSYYDTIKSNTEYDAGFNAAMWSFSKLQNHIIAHNYGGFKDIKCLVDVGGGMGGALALLVDVHPHIRGINFDLPHVIDNAPVIAGDPLPPYSSNTSMNWETKVDCSVMEQVLVKKISVMKLTL